MSAGAGELSGHAAKLIAWLDHRAEPSPASLRARLAAAIEATRGGADGSLVTRSSLAGEQLLGELLQRGCGARGEAPDLLAADALVTYAFEAAAEDESLDPHAIDDHAMAAMKRIAALGGPELA